MQQVVDLGQPELEAPAELALESNQHRPDLLDRRHVAVLLGRPVSDTKRIEKLQSKALGVIQGVKNEPLQGRHTTCRKELIVARHLGLQRHLGRDGEELRSKVKQGPAHCPGRMSGCDRDPPASGECRPC